jgi:hypothetical protein
MGICPVQILKIPLFGDHVLENSSKHNVDR